MAAAYDGLSRDHELHKPVSVRVCVAVDVSPVVPVAVVLNFGIAVFIRPEAGDDFPNEPLRRSVVAAKSRCCFANGILSYEAGARSALDTREEMLRRGLARRRRHLKSRS